MHAKNNINKFLYKAMFYTNTGWDVAVWFEILGW